MKLRLDNWKKISSNPTHTVLQHEDGHKITVAHSALSPKYRGQLAALKVGGGHMADKPKMMAEGGEATPETAAPEAKAPVTINIGSPSAPQGIENPNPGSQFAAKSNAIKQINPALQVENLPYGVTPEMVEQMKAQAMSQTSPQSAPQAQQSPTAMSAPTQAPSGSQWSPPSNPETAKSSGVGVPDVENAYITGQQGITAQSQAEGALGTAQADILKNQVALEQGAMAHANNLYNALNQERMSFVNDINNRHIDPSNYWNSKDTGSKVSTAIGLILGGIGAGATHGPNQALDFLNSNIARDIESQKSNLGKTNSLLSANLHQFGNMRDATEMTRLMQSDIISNQLKQAAATAQDPMAKARALQMSAQLEQQAAPGFQRLAMRTALTRPGSPGNQLVQQDPAKYVRFIADEKDQPGLYKEIGEAQQTTKAARNIMSTFDKVSRLQTVGNRAGSPIQSHSQIEALTAPITAGLSKETAGRFTEQDANYLSTLWPKLSDSAKTVALKKAQIQKLVTEKMNFPMLKAYDLDPEKFGSTSGAAENAPADEIQTRNGVPYKRVPGGWQKVQ